MSLLVRRGDSPQDRFAAEVLELFRADGRVEDAWYDRDQFAISVRPVDAAPVWAPLADLYQQWGPADPASRAVPLRTFVDAAIKPPELPTNWSEARSLVRPVMRGITTAVPPRPEPESGALWRRCLPYLAEVVELDLPGSPLVTVGHAAGWGVPGEEVFAAARQNLAARQLRPQLSGPEGPRVVRLVDDGNTYCVSHLLIDGWLAGFSWHLGGRPVAFAPDRATLLIAPDDPRVLTSVFEMIEEEYDQSARPVSPAAYTVDRSGRLAPYEAPPGHPLYAPVGRAERLLAVAEYREQKRWLDDSGSPHRAGTVMIAGRTDGSVFSVATILTDGATLLPRTDYVGVAGEMLFVPWADAERILGLEPEPDLEPPRFLVEASLVAGPHPALRAASVNPSAPIH
jgi:hypothetical protein